MNILILGGTGFLGYHLAVRLSHQHTVRVYSPSAGRTNFPGTIEGVTAFIADTGELKKQVEWANLIFHFVSTTNPKTSLKDPYHDVVSNLLPVVQLMEMLKGSRDKKMIFCSSGGAVYGHSGKAIIGEEHKKNPSTSYGLVKSTIEEYIMYYSRNFELPYIILRPANVYGFKSRSIGEQGIISTLIYNAIHRLPTRFWANLNNIRDLVFIDDFVTAVIALIKCNATGIFNIGGGCGYSLLQMIDAVQENCDTELLIEKADHTIADEAINILDITKINSLTGWQPQIGINEGIGLVYNQMQKEFSVVELSENFDQ